MKSSAITPRYGIRVMVSSNQTIRIKEKYCRSVDMENLPLVGDLNTASQDRVAGPEGGTAIGLTNGTVRSTIR